MSTIKANTLTGTSTAGSIAVTGEGNSTTTNLQQGLAKAWFEFTSVTTTTMTDSFNTSVSVDNGTGDTSLSFTNNMSSSVYVAAASDVSYNTAFNTSLGHYVESTQTSKQKTSSSFTVVYSAHSGTSVLDHSENMGTVHGDLA